MQPTRFHPSLYLIPLVCILLAGAALQFNGLHSMTQMLNYDEAYNSVDALSLLERPRLELFFPGNYGREGTWMYLLAPAFAALGVLPLVPRIVTMLIGLLTLAAVYRLGREILGGRAAIWAMAGLAVLYWHVQIAHLAFRANLLPLVGTLAFAALFRAHRRNKTADWMWSGGLFGLLAYTYLAAPLWIAYGFLVQGWWLLRHQDRRRGALLSLVMTVLLALPLVSYVLSHPTESSSRVTDVARLDTGLIAESLYRWGEAWFCRGSTYAGHGLPGHPILDVPLAGLFLVGVLGIWWAARKARLAGWVYGLVFVSLVPSIFSDLPPHLLRAVGTTIPIALVLGTGVEIVERGLRRAGRYAFVFPLALLCWAGANTYRDVQQWLDLPDLFPIMEQHVHIGADYVLDDVPVGTLVYFSPFTPGHPVVSFTKARLKAYPVRAFDGNTCLVAADRPAVYVSAVQFDPMLASKLEQWTDAETLAEDTAAASPRYAIYQAVANQELLSGWGGDTTVIFGARLQVRIIDPPPDTVLPGDTLPITLAFRALHTVDRPYHIFLHLYGDPTPYEGGLMWSQTDARVCDSYPTPNWAEHEIIVQSFALAVPEDVEPGNYVVALGLYEPATGTRLPLTSPAGQVDYFEGWYVTIGQNEQ